MTLSTQNESQEITQSDIIEMMRDKGRMDALDLKHRLDTIEQNQLDTMDAIADLYLMQDTQNGGATV